MSFVSRNALPRQIEKFTVGLTVYFVMEKRKIACFCYSWEKNYIVGKKQNENKSFGMLIRYLALYITPRFWASIRTVLAFSIQL